VAEAATTVTIESPILAALANRSAGGTLLVGDGGAVTAADSLRFIDAMRAVGVNESTRVCAAMPNDRLLALTALASMSIGSFAPLNPRLPEDDLVNLMTDLAADVLIVTAGFGPAARRAARRCGMRVIEVAHPAAFTVLERETRGPTEHPARHALLLHTSGTTSRPKLVGLTAENLISSASAVAGTLQLSPLDRCLNVMPLFHIHGLVGVLLASVVAGASVEVARYDPFAYRRRLGSADITWTSAVPSMYRAMLARPSDVAVGARLRLLRSSSAPLPPSVWRELEDAFACPVVNAYGMTEASHQMASNPLPPGERRLGTVGPSAGAEIAVLADGAISRAPDVVGEVVVRGPGVMHEYLSPASANETAWHDGWFRTGDLGSLDGQSYLTLHGRIKEIINVSGEKVSPYEVEAVLLRHPSVVDAVAFAAPDRIRGEQVCVAVVLRRGVGSLDDLELRRFAADHLATFKTPRRVIELDQIPVGPTGKVQRARLSSLLGLADESA
jgi:acyl-CoA synthetase (AMP-forming)/AMP-acid ligase II